MVKPTLERLRSIFYQLNLFETNSTDETVVKSERLTTRIYLILIIIFLLVTSLTLLTMAHPINAYVSSPSQQTFRDLSHAFSSTLQCPCSQIATQYQSFTTIRFQLHQVCTSSFVTQSWIQAISNDQNHIQMSFFWQIIAGFCQRSQSSVQMIIDQLALTTLLTPSAIVDDLLRTQTRVAFDGVLASTRSIFFRNLFSIQRVIVGNQFVSGLATNFDARWITNNSTSQPALFDRVYNGCSCLNLDGCPQSQMAGIVSDCLMINGVLQSSLQCYYDGTCLTQLYPSIPSINPLDIEQDHQSSMNSTIKDLLDRFLIDQLSIDVDFAAYYAECRPKYCVYTYHRRFDVIYTLTIMIGIFSALNVVLRFLAPFIASRIVRQPPMTVEVVTHRTHNRWRHILQSLWRSVTSLNLFASRVLDEDSLPRQRLTTRVFIAIMLMGVIVSGVYIFFSIETQVITVSQPSLEKYEELYENHSSSLSCPCSHISVPYGKFLTINYSLHQICSSTLISPEWLKLTLSYGQSPLMGTGSLLFIDFRRLAPSYFQLVATVCSLIHQTFDDALKTLEENQFINQYLPTQSQFLEQVSSLNQSWTTSLKQQIISMQNWLYLITTQSYFLIGLGMNGYLIATNGSNVVQVSERDLGLFGQVTETSFSVRGVCSCRRTPTSCQIVSLLPAVNATRSYSPRNLIGLNAGCIPWLGLLKTNITWWYRTDIIEQIRLLFGDHLRNQSDPIITSLSNQTQTRFRYQNGTYPTFENILAEALLEEWTGNLSRFDLFYAECAPKECTYLIQSERRRLAAFLLLVSICGGLNQILRWIILLICSILFYMRDRYRHRFERGRLNIIETIRRSLLEFNLYRSRWTDEVHVRREKLQTRVYICIVFFAMLILMVYTSLEEQAVVESIGAPKNATEYELFRAVYGDTLECPCTRISLEYKSLIPKLQAKSFHPICNSTFIGDFWFTYLIPSQGLPRYIQNEDFRLWMVGFFRLLASFCSVVRDQLSQYLSAFLSSSMIINRVISAVEFEGQLNTTLRHFQQQIPAQFAQTVDLIRMSHQGNGLVSVFATNWQYLVQNNNRSNGSVLRRQTVIYDNGTCSCAASHRCSMPAKLFDVNGTAFFNVPFVRLGCTILESVLQSSLACFYSMSCIDSLTDAFPRGNTNLNPSFIRTPGSFRPINNTVSSFAISDSLETVVNRMFINEWEQEISYDGFFVGCKPRECTYTLHYRFAALELVTRFLSVFGGLSIAARFLVPYLTIIISKASRQNSIHPN